MTRATLLICNETGRENLLARAKRQLPEGHCLVEVRDLVGRRRACRTTPLSPRAELVASEPALVLRGGLTVLVSYYRVPSDELSAREQHSEEGTPTHAYDVTLRVACRGSAAARPIAA